MELNQELEFELEENEDQAEQKQKKPSWLVWLLLIIILLFLLSCYMLGSHLYDMATREQYVVNMVADENTEITIFHMEYSNETGNITVSGMDKGEDVVAPGTEEEYVLRLKNEDDVDIRYVLTAGQSFYTEDEVPLLIRLADEHGNFLLGSEEEWVKVSALNDLVYKGMIPVDEVESLFFHWKWEFEGDDVYDTYLGNLTGEDIAGVNVAFWLECTGDATEAMSENIFVHHSHNWGCCYCCYLAWIILLIALVTVLYAWRIRKKLRKAEERLEELEERMQMFGQLDEGTEDNGREVGNENPEVQ